jgi:hypothetical protein
MKLSAPVLGGVFAMMGMVSASPSPFLPGDWFVDNNDTPGDEAFWITVWPETNYNGQKKNFVSDLNQCKHHLMTKQADGYILAR